MTCNVESNDKIFMKYICGPEKDRFFFESLAKLKLNLQIRIEYVLDA